MKIRQIARLCQVCCVANVALALLTACSDDNQEARTQVASGANADGLTLMIDVSGQVTSAPQEGCYKLMLRPDGTFYRLQKGGNSTWKTADKSTLPLRSAATQTSSYYIIEVAIPWSGLALSEPPTDRRLAFTLECTDNRSGTAYTETIPDASQMRPYTWMEMRLGKMAEETGIGVNPLSLPKGVGTYDLKGRKVSSRYSLLAHPSSKILIRNGKKYISR